MSIRALHPHEHVVNAGFSLSGSRHQDREAMMVLDIRRPKSEDIEPDADIPLEEWRITTEPGNEVT